MKNGCQEPPCNCRTSLIFLRFLRSVMGTMMVGIILIQLDFAWHFQKCIILGVLSEKWLSRTSLYLEDILNLLEVPEVSDGDHDGWSHPHLTGCCLTFSKMYNTWGVKQNMIIRNLPGLGGCPWSSWHSWWWSWWLGSSFLMPMTLPNSIEHFQINNKLNMLK